MVMVVAMACVPVESRVYRETAHQETCSAKVVLVDSHSFTGVLEDVGFAGLQPDPSLAQLHSGERAQNVHRDPSGKRMAIRSSESLSHL